MIPDAPQDKIPVLSDELWATRYEEMRNRVMAKSCSIDNVYGYALLVRRGLVAWMNAWPRPAQEPPRNPGFSSTVDAITVPSHLLRSATSLFVNLILSRPMEVAHE
jgi:hypothetical protein